MPSYEVVGRSADGRTVVYRRRERRVVGNLVQPSFAYVAAAAGRDGDPSAGPVLGRTGEPGLRAALARVLGEAGADAAIADELRALTRPWG